VQSEIKEIAELHLLFSMITPNKWVETDPTLKDLVSTLHEDLSYGLLGYPVLQTADILVVRGQFVPVGEDQLAHLEIARDIARRFNHLYQTELFPEPKALLTPVSKLAGLDGRKMSKSYGNAINIADSEEETWQKVKTAITDPARVKRTDPGNPEACVAVYQYYKVFADEATTALAAEECSSAKRGCMDCKKILSDVINAQMAPLRQRRAELAETPDKVNQVLDQGIAQMRPKCQTTLEATRKTMHLFGTTK
jgi:tryptophanyl-tRNA synthetase